jgi:hypothetical protein
VRLTRNRVIGTLGAIWGGAVVISGLMRNLSGDGAYAAGQITGFAFGSVMLVAGLFYAIKG